MLILSRKVNERIVIGDEIEVAVVEIRGDQVKLGIVAPQNVTVHRREVFDQIQEENRAAAQGTAADLSELSGLFPSDASTQGERLSSQDSTAPSDSSDQSNSSDRSES